MPKFLVSAEANLDYPFLEHRPQVRSARKDDLCRAFSQATQLAVKERVDFFIVAGNLLHEHTPANDTLSFVVGQMDELTRLSPRTQVVLIPGDRETGPSGSALRVLKFIDHVNVLDPTESPSLNFNIASGNVTMVCVDAKTGVQPRSLPSIPRGFGVLLTYATYHNFFQAHPEDKRRREEVLTALRDRGYGLVVLGQGLRAASWGLDELPCITPGAMEHIYLKEERAHPCSVSVIETHQEGARYKQVELETRRVMSHSVLFQLGDSSPRRKLEPLLKDLDHETIFRLELQGELHFKQFREMKLEMFLEKARERGFDTVFHNNLFLVDDDYLQAGPDITVIKPKMEFVRTMHDLIESADEKEGKGGTRTKLLKRVLELGVREFEGDS